MFCEYCHQGSEVGVAFSGGDIATFDDYFSVENGQFRLVEAGTKRFGLMVVDETKAKEFFGKNSDNQIQKTWNEAFKKAKGTFQEKVLAANKRVIGNSKDSGLLFLETTNKNKTN